MSDLNVTSEERDYIERVARERPGIGSRIGFYAAVFTPMVLFAAYGALNRDFIAVLVAFVGLLMVILWRIGQEFNHLRVFQSALRKVVEHERTSEIK